MPSPDSHPMDGQGGCCHKTRRAAAYYMHLQTPDSRVARLASTPHIWVWCVDARHLTIIPTCCCAGYTASGRRRDSPICTRNVNEESGDHRGEPRDSRPVQRVGDTWDGRHWRQSGGKPLHLQPATIAPHYPLEWRGPMPDDEDGRAECPAKLAQMEQWSSGYRNLSC